MPKTLAMALTLLLGAAVTQGARAEEQGAETAAPPRTARFWQAAHGPDKLRASSLVRQARALLYPALGRSSMLGSLRQARRLAIDAALTRLAIARRMDPGNLEALYLTGMGLSQWEARDASGQVQRRDEEAIAVLEKLSALAPDYEPFEIAFELAILYTRVERFERARQAWHRALEVELGEPSLPTVYSNLAEVTMMAGDLAEAATLYERAVELGDGESRILPMWGLAVVLDRLGEPGEALHWAERAIEEDQRPMAVLRAPGVFFVPAYELHYYTGLGHVAVASQAHGQPVDACATPLSSGRALATESREALQNVVRLSEQLRTLAPELPDLRALEERAQKRLTERNRKARRSGATSAEPSRETQAFVAALAALRDFHRYLDEGGRQGSFAEAARRRIEALEECLRLRSDRQ